jgi:hypothetical protein
VPELAAIDPNAVVPAADAADAPMDTALAVELVPTGAAAPSTVNSSVPAAAPLATPAATPAPIPSAPPPQVIQAQ